ncbi:hypothetical protein RCO28_14765 [Streptomyces sp. LHD-70]|uniref:hypothetical protein n=1 Tax=Streptomyces sp. LHD-70 TaxID=3072140 RepID=UPI00280E3E82|nr:hypothetical protein [Streptomyces sp. LHD-70]MDQ8703743.1 hypothetical protein [Streptomyces sp. LHD-70]
MDPATTLGSYVESWSPPAVLDEDSLPPGPAAALSAALDLPEPAAGPGDPLPPLWHWLYFLEWPAQHDLGPDGHPSDARFLPPIPDRQRMFAGGRCETVGPLRVGEPAQRVCSLSSVTPKSGRSGELLFVTERREFRQSGRTCLVEEQDIVYRAGRSAAAQHPTTLDTSTRACPHSDAPWQLRSQPDERLLFRFSALTANAHRIHYDAPYCRDVEGYPGLVVHGPLLALLMLELVRRNSPQQRVSSLSYRLCKPAFTGEHLLATGTPTAADAELSIATHREARHATAEVTFA